MTDLAVYLQARLLPALSRDQAEHAVVTLAQTRLPLVEPGSELEQRIWLGIVMLVCDPPGWLQSEPEASDRFAAALRLAQADWRDLLVAAGLENADWRDVLVRAGYRPPS